MDTLLAAIESGFGSHTAFNIKVRRTSLAHPNLPHNPTTAFHIKVRRKSLVHPKPTPNPNPNPNQVRRTSLALLRNLRDRKKPGDRGANEIREVTAAIEAPSAMI